MILYNRNHRESITSRLVYADRYWNPAGSPANTNDTSSWSASDGGATGESVPTSSDNVYFTSTNNNNAVVNATFTTADIDFAGGTGYTGTLSGSSALNVYGDMVLSSTMTLTFGGPLTFKPATGTTKTLTSDTKTFSGANLNLNGAGTLQLADAFSNATSVGQIVLSNGYFDTNEQTVATGYFTAESGTDGVDITNSVITISGAVTPGWTYQTSANPVTTGSSIIITSVGNFAGNGKTYADVQLTGARHTISGNNTFTTLTRVGTAGKDRTFTITAGSVQTIGTLKILGDSAVNRPLVKSSTIGTQYTLAVTTFDTDSGNFDIQDANFSSAKDISAYALTSGDCGGNTGLTLTAPATTDCSAGTTWSTATWDVRVPLPQDSATFSGSSRTITQDMPRIGSVDFTGSSGLTWTTSADCSVFGSIDLTDLATLTASTNTYTFEGRGTYSLDTAGKTWAKAITLNAPSGTLKLTSDYTNGSTITTTVTNGTFTAVDGANDYVISTGNVSVGTAGTITLGSATHLLTGTGTVWTGTGTISASTGTLKITNTSTSVITFVAGTSQTYNNIWFARGASTATNTITATTAVTFADIKDTGTANHTNVMPNVTINHTSLTWDDHGTGVITWTRTGASGNWTLNDTTGTNAVNYCNISNSIAQGGATYNAFTSLNNVDGGGNTGWVFSTGGTLNNLLLLGVG